jgi:hypothetical protein
VQQPASRARGRPQAAILAARRNLKEISKEEISDALERIVAGPEKKGAIVTEAKKRLVAYHEVPTLSLTLPYTLTLCAARPVRKRACSALPAGRRGLCWAQPPPSPPVGYSVTWRPSLPMGVRQVVRFAVREQALAQAVIDHWRQASRQGITNKA